MARGIPADPRIRPVGRARHADPQDRRLDDALFALTGALGAWSLALIALTVFRIIDPTRDPDDDLSALKSVGAITVTLIAVEQAFTMGAAMGKVPKLGLPMRTLMRTHRYVGRIGLALAAVVAFFCWTVSPAPTRGGAIHGAFASSGFLAISIKLAMLKWRPALAYRAAQPTKLAGPCSTMAASTTTVLTTIEELPLSGLRGPAAGTSTG